MKDKIISAARIIIGWWIAWYTGYLLFNNLVIVKDAFVSSNQIIAWIIMFIGAFIFFMWVYPLCIPKARIIQLFFWIFLILFSYYFLQDNPSKLIFVWDILRILWALLCILGPMWVCIPDKCKKQAEESKIEIIEV